MLSFHYYSLFYSLCNNVESYSCRRTLGFAIFGFCSSSLGFLIVIIKFFFFLLVFEILFCSSIFWWHPRFDYLVLFMSFPHRRRDFISPDLNLIFYSWCTVKVSVDELARFSCIKLVSFVIFWFFCAFGIDFLSALLCDVMVPLSLSAAVLCLHYRLRLLVSNASRYASLHILFEH